MVEDLLNSYYNIWPPELDGQQDGDDWQRVLARIAYDQMPYQVPLWTSLIRALCLFGEDTRFGPPILDGRRWQDTLGVPLPQFLRIGFGMYSEALRSGGSVPRSALLSDGYVPHFAPVSAKQAMEIVDMWLARPVDRLAHLGRANTPSPDDLWAYNPLYEHPIVVLDGGTYVIPSPQAILQRLGPQGLYFLGRDVVKEDGARAFQRFASRLGKRYERYIGEQLRLLTHATLHSEVSYGRSQKGVDYIIETPEVVVLVEAKSVAPNASTRSGIFPDNGDMDRGINRACQQITHTAQLMEGGHPEFPDLKARPLRGLVVTRERYLNLPWHHLTDVVKPASIPTTIVSADQLEYALIPGLDDETCGAQLLDALATDTEPIGTSLDRLGTGMNPLLEEAAVAASLKQPYHSNT